MPAKVVTDNCTQFAEQSIDQLCELASIDASKIHAYSKEENDLVWKANKGFHHLIPMVNGKKCKDDFATFLPCLQDGAWNFENFSISIGFWQFDRSWFSLYHVPKKQLYRVQIHWSHWTFVEL